MNTVTDPDDGFRLNERQRRCIEFVCAGDDYADAYGKAGFDTIDVGQRRSACCRLMKDPHARRYLNHLRSLRQSSIVLSLEEKREYFARVVRTPLSEIDETSDLAAEVRDTADGKIVKSVCKMRAIELDNKLAGHGSTRVDFGTSPELAAVIQSIRESAE